MFSFSMSFKIELTWLIPSDCNVLIKHLSWLCSPKSHTFWAMSRSPNVAWMKTVITKNALILSKKKYCFSSVSSFLFSVKTQVSFLWFFVSNKKFLFHLLLFQLHTLFSRVFFFCFLVVVVKNFTNVCALQSLSDNWIELSIVAGEQQRIQLLLLLV